MAEHCQSNVNASGGISDGNALGNVITSENLLVGSVTTILTGYLWYGSSMTGTIYGRVYNSAGTLVHTYGSIDASILTNNELPYNFSGGGDYTMSTNDRVVFELDLTNAGNARYAVQTSAETGWERIERSSGSWSSPEDNVAVKMCITYTAGPPPTTTTVTMPPPYANIGLSGL